jgi:ABC-2 type transport system ATP-binding protein
MPADQSSNAAVSVRKLSFSYGDRLAVNEISFDVAVGEVLGLLGPNGAGKSTTIKMVIGQLRPAEGSITILGSNMPKNRDVIQARMGVCSEEKNLYLNMTAVENLKFFAQLFGIKQPDIDGLLDRVNLLDRKNERVSSFSKGMRQRLMMARALVNRPDVIVLDEPTDGLDPVSSIAIRDLIRQEAQRGAAVILTTHDMHEADTLSDRVAFINDGSILKTNTPEALKLEYGQRTVKIRIQEDQQVTERVVPIGGSDSGAMIAAALGDPDLLTVHSSEATLEDVFVKVAGRTL